MRVRANRESAFMGSSSQSAPRPFKINAQLAAPDVEQRSNELRRRYPGSGKRRALAHRRKTVDAAPRPRRRRKVSA